MTDYATSDRPIEIYIISNSGLCFTNVKNKHSQQCTIKADQDIISPLLSGLDIVIQNAFGANLEDMVLDNKLKLSIRRYKIAKQEFKLVALVRKQTSNVDIHKKLGDIYFALKDNNWDKYLNSNQIPESIYKAIYNKVESILYH